MIQESLKILFADDDPTTRLLMQSAMQKMGFEVTIACNGAEAVAFFRKAVFDMVLLDVEMPAMDGFEVCELLREEAGNELPIIMTTGMDDEQSINDAFEAGATDFISKPINWNLIGHRLLYLRRSSVNLLALKTINARSRAILHAIPDTMFILDSDNHVINIQTDARKPEAISLRKWFPDDVVKIYLDAANRIRAGATIEHLEYQLRQNDNKARFYESKITAIDSQETLCLVRDITERKDVENRILRLAYFDTLTGLPNRQSFAEKLNREIERIRNTGNNLKIAVLFLDLDHFKGINDALGHNTGDLILKGTAERLMTVTRSSEFALHISTHDAEIEVARLGGDEFTVIIPDIVCTEDVIAVAHRIQKVMSEPFHLESRDVVLTTSIGVAVFPDDGEDVDGLLKHADSAMYDAKSKGRDNFQFYNASLTEQAEKRLHMGNDLRDALRRNEFYLVYQPQYDIASTSILSVEVLIWWKHPKRGLVSPADFIPLAEENGLIVSIGEWVLQTACSVAAQWQNNGCPMRVAVNLSPIQIKGPDLVQMVLGILEKTGLSPQWLELEVTENSLMELGSATLQKLLILRSKGIQIALDDFGTSYSSMNYLKRLPVNNIKIDQSFTNQMLDDNDSFSIVRAIISLSRNLGFTVTAEGVETLDQAVALKQLGCDTLQGYYFSKPILLHELDEFRKKSWSVEALIEKGPHVVSGPVGGHTTETSITTSANVIVMTNKTKEASSLS